jgi:hypothetical protein
MSLQLHFEYFFVVVLEQKKKEISLRGYKDKKTSWKVVFINSMTYLRMYLPKSMYFRIT